MLDAEFQGRKRGGWWRKRSAKAPKHTASLRLACPGEVRALRFFGYGIPTIRAVLTAVAAGMIASDEEGMWLPGDVLLCLDVIMGMISTSGSELYGADALVAMVISQLLVH